MGFSAMLADKYILIVPFSFSYSLGWTNKAAPQNIFSSSLILLSSGRANESQSISTAEGPESCAKPYRVSKFLTIFLLFLFSCGQESVMQKQPVKIKDTLPDVRLDSAYPGHEAFNWNWERPKGKILLSASITKYIKMGQEPIDTFSGDINNDNILDLILVTGIIGEDSLRFSGIDLPRELLVFAGQGNETYKFLFKNSKAIPCGNCCGMSDPYGGMTINKGQIIINEYCASNWKSISEYRFRYNSKLADWLLDTVVTESYAFDHDYYNLDTTTQKDFGKKALRNFIMYDEEEK